MIIGVVVKFGLYIEVRMPAPNRHHDCLRHFSDLAGDKFSMFECNGKQQGFYTDKGVFLDREQALKHVQECGQKTIETPNKYLFSENLW